MAKIVQDNIVITVSKIAKDDAAEDGFIPAEVKAELETIVVALLGDTYVIDIL